jgi:hypothetical protein
LISASGSDQYGSLGSISTYEIEGPYSDSGNDTSGGQSTTPTPTTYSYAYYDGYAATASVGGATTPVQLGLIPGVSGSALSIAANLAETSLNIGVDFPGGTDGTQFRFDLGFADSTYEPPLSVIVYRGGETDGAGTADSGFDAPGNLSDATAAPDTDSASANGLPTQEEGKDTHCIASRPCRVRLSPSRCLFLKTSR